MDSRRPLLLLLLTSGLALTGCSGGRPPRAEGPRVATRDVSSEGGRVHFDMEDPRGDDRGTGRYEYPTSFQGRFGFLDITRFRVLDSGRFVTFLIEFRRPIPRRRPDGFTETKGYYLQLLDIYVDTDGKAESGRDWALPGRSVRFDARSGWEKMVLVTPGHSRTLELMLRDRTSDLELVGARNDIYIPERVYPQAYDIKVVVPKDELGGEPQPHWGYQVLAMSYDPDNLTRNQLQNGRVQRFPDEFRFGGGDDGEGDPNVLDLLAPTEDEQYRWLSNYRSSTYASSNRYAVIPMIRAQEAPEDPPPPERDGAGPAPDPEPEPTSGPPALPEPADDAGFRQAPAPARAAPPAPPEGDSGWKRPPKDGAAGGEEPEFSFDFAPLSEGGR